MLRALRAEYATGVSHVSILDRPLQSLQNKVGSYARRLSVPVPLIRGPFLLSAWHLPPDGLEVKGIDNPVLDLYLRTAPV